MDAHMTPREPSTALIQALVAEVGLANSLRGVDQQFHRRAIVRILFSVLEGYSFILGQRALEVGHRSGFAFSARQLKRLGQPSASPSLDDTSKPSSQPEGSQKGLGFSIAMYAAVMGVSTPEPTPEDAVGIGFAVRNRRTHPKSAESFTISDQEAAAIAIVIDWFQKVAAWYTTVQVQSYSKIAEAFGHRVDDILAPVDAAMKKPSV
jgi:hypothetical protein